MKHPPASRLAMYTAAHLSPMRRWHGSGVHSSSNQMRSTPATQARSASISVGASGASCTPPASPSAAARTETVTRLRPRVHPRPDRAPPALLALHRAGERFAFAAGRTPHAREVHACAVGGDACGVRADAERRTAVRIVAGVRGLSSRRRVASHVEHRGYGGGHGGRGVFILAQVPV
jgi:hypothetical protein